MPEIFHSDFILNSIKGSLLGKGRDAFSSITTDSRQIQKGQVFFALKGKHFDGHDFLNQAFHQGAAGFVVSNKKKAQTLLQNKGLNIFYVPDTLKALQNLARCWSKKMNTRVLAVTGSNGKTTSKHFAKTLLSPLKPFASPKSYNNVIGVSLSLLGVCQKDSILVQELGTNRPGEIAYLTSLCRPFVSAVTMVGPSHLEGLSSLNKIAKEKQQIYLQSPKALWLFNRDNPFTEKMFQTLSPSHKKVLSFSKKQKKADVQLRFVKETAKSSLIEGCISSVPFQTRLSFYGQQNLENLMCACGLALGASIPPEEIWNLIPQCQLPKGRQNWFHIKEKNLSILFDAYNANPSSMTFFLESCEKFSKTEKRLFVLGDMKELGRNSEKYHQQIAQHKALLSSRFIAFVGEYGKIVKEALKAKGFKGVFVSAKTYHDILSPLKKELKRGDTLAVKASRSLRLEKLIFDLTDIKIFDS